MSGAEIRALRKLEDALRTATNATELAAYEFRLERLLLEGKGEDDEEVVHCRQLILDYKRILHG